MRLDESPRLNETQLSTQSSQRQICRRTIGMTPLATLKLSQLKEHVSYSAWGDCRSQ